MHKKKLTSFEGVYECMEVEPKLLSLGGEGFLDISGEMFGTAETDGRDGRLEGLLLRFSLVTTLRKSEEIGLME